MTEENNLRITEADASERERLLALALMVVLKTRNAGVVIADVIADEERRIMFFTDGNDLRMTTVDMDDPFALGMFTVEDGNSHTVN